MEKSDQEVMYSSKYINSNYMDFFVYDTHKKLIWESGEGIRMKNKIIKHWGPKTNTNKISPSSILVFVFYPHTDTCDILLEDLALSIFQTYYLKSLHCIEVYKES